MEVKIKRSFWTGKYKGMEVKGTPTQLSDFHHTKNATEMYMREKGIDKLEGDNPWDILNKARGHYIGGEWNSYR